jgi:hypothetical protein
MTDARFPERWLNDRRIVRLSDRDFRGFVGALAWCAANRTDGAIGYDDLDLIRWCDRDVIAALLKAELVTDTGTGWQLCDYEMTQRTAAQLASDDRLRMYERDKKRRQRAHNTGDHSLCSQSNCRALSPGRP